MTESGLFELQQRETLSEPDGKTPGRHKYVKPDSGMQIVRPGAAEGTLFGGNLGTLFLLQGTPYWPRLTEPVVLFIEEDDLAGDLTVPEALRRIHSLLLQPGLTAPEGLVLGSFQPNAQVNEDDLREALLGIPALKDRPIVVNAPFGHTNPMITLPIGGQASVDALGDAPRVTLVS